MPAKCPWCGRWFASEDSRYDHARAKHLDKSLKDILPASVVARRARQAERDRARQAEQEHESLADIAIDATIRQSMGEPLTDLEQSLVP